MYACVARACVHAAAGGSKAAKAAAKAAAKQDKRNAKLKEQRAAEAAAGAKKRVSELQVGRRAVWLQLPTDGCTAVAVRTRASSVMATAHHASCPAPGASLLLAMGCQVKKGGSRQNPSSKASSIRHALSLSLLLDCTQTETEQFNKAIKGVKSRARALMQQGMSAKVAQKMAQKEVTGEWRGIEVV